MGSKAANGVNEYSIMFGIIINAAKTLDIVPIDDMLQTVERAESFGCFMDPTAWMQGHKNLPPQREVLEAARDFVAAVKKHATKELHDAN